MEITRNFDLTSLDKASKQNLFLEQYRLLLEGENDLIANMSNTAAFLKEFFDYFWVGFYLNKNEELVLGPFQGPTACTRIAFERGVCGACARTQKTIIVPDVDQFPGHISCNSASKSEIVVPVMKQNKLIAVLDIDEPHYDAFDSKDQVFLEEVVQLLTNTII